MKTKLVSSVKILVCLAIATLFMLNARTYMDVFIEGINIWAYNVLPALLPFSLIAKLILAKDNNQLSNNIYIPQKVFKLSKTHLYTIFASLLCGYPIGAKLACKLPQGTSILRRQKSMLVAICSTAGPVFMVGTLGASFLQNNKAVIILIASHYLGALLNGIIYSFKECHTNLQQDNAIQPSQFTHDYMTDSLLSVTAVGGYVAVFYVLQQMLRNLLGNCNFAGLEFLLGLLEMTGGCYNVCNNYDLFASTVLCCTLISVGGLCVIMQCSTYLNKQGYSTLSVIKMKINHGALSTIICFALAKLFSL